MTALAAEWNELVIVAKKDDQVHVFSAWKRAVGSWLAPDRWIDPANWPNGGGLVKMPDGTPWAPQSYGIVAFDFDSKTCWSFNDFQVPGSGFFLDEHGKGVSHFQAPSYKLSKDPLGRDLSGVAWAGILKDPACWADVHVEGAPAGGMSKGKSPVKTDFTLADMLKDIDLTQTTAAQIDGMMGTTRGILRFDSQDFWSMGVEYRPPGWTIHRDWEFGDTLNGVLTLAETLQGWAGFDQAAWAAHVQDKLEDYLSVDNSGDTSWGSLAQMIHTALEEEPDMADDLSGVEERLRGLENSAAGVQALTDTPTSKKPLR